MARICKVCQLPREKRRELDIELIKGKSKTEIALKYGVPYHSVDYHQKHHLLPKMAQGQETKCRNDGIEVLNELTTLMDQTQAILDKATDRDQNALALGAIREMRGNLTLISNIQAWVILHNQEGGGKLSTEELHQQELNELSKKTIEENMDCLSSEEQECYFALIMKLMNGDNNKIARIRYNPIINVAAHSRMKRTKAPQYTTQGEKPQEIASTTVDIEEKEEYEGVKEIIPTELKEGYRRERR